MWLGKGCSPVLIPARVVQALQLHFDKTAAMSGPKVPAGFPPLHGTTIYYQQLNLICCLLVLHASCCFLTPPKPNTCSFLCILNCENNFFFIIFLSTNF